jgi:hypothetical protein
MSSFKIERIAFYPSFGKCMTIAVCRQALSCRMGDKNGPAIACDAWFDSCFQPQENAKITKKKSHGVQASLLCVLCVLSRQFALLLFRSNVIAVTHSEGIRTRKTLNPSIHPLISNRLRSRFDAYEVFYASALCIKTGFAPCF